jgi:hypothetical protein
MRRLTPIAVDAAPLWTRSHSPAAALVIGVSFASEIVSGAAKLGVKPRDVE